MITLADCNGVWLQVTVWDARCGVQRSCKILGKVLRAAGAQSVLIALHWQRSGTARAHQDHVKAFHS